jgi:predicted aldo/keto reductase-like oxidoreductase
MKYRKFGRTDWNVSALGFGAMRLPIKGADTAKINEAEAIRMIRYAIDHGVNYVDTAYPYHGGNSEVLVGKALENGYREKVRLATKMPTWLVNSQQDMDKFLRIQLRRLQVDQIDFCLLHGLRKKVWPKLRRLGVFDWAERKMRQGKIGYLGFSFHDEYLLFKKIIDSYDWPFCQIQYNYVDTEYQAGRRGLKYAASKGMAIIVMEPIAGGNLAVTPPKDIQAIWNRAGLQFEPAKLALQWVWNHPEVSVVLSGMSTLKQVKENLKTANMSMPGTLTQKELRIFDRVAKRYNELGFLGCTGCRYCMDCPQGVSIPQILSLYNEYLAKGRDNEIKRKYWEQIAPQNRAKLCIRCRRCEKLCTQHLPIGEILSRASWVFDQNQ